jgi:hypothetical protein
MGVKNYFTGRPSIQFAYKSVVAHKTVCVLSFEKHKVEIEMRSQDFVKLQAAGLFDHVGNSVVFNALSVTGE